VVAPFGDIDAPLDDLGAAIVTDRFADLIAAVETLHRMAARAENAAAI